MIMDAEKLQSGIKDITELIGKIYYQQHEAGTDTFEMYEYQVKSILDKIYTLDQENAKDRTELFKNIFHILIETLVYLRGYGYDMELSGFYYALLKELNEWPEIRETIKEEN